MADLAQAWREKGTAAAEVVQLELPSGVTIQARRPGPAQLMMWDRLPLTLAAMFDGGVTAGQMSREEAEEANDFLYELLAYSVVAPRIVRKAAGPGEIAAREIPDGDLVWLVGWCLRLQEAEAMRSFRDGGKDGGGDRHGERVLRATVGAPRPGGSGVGSGVRPGGDAAGDRTAEGNGGRE